jgi:aminomethyltransferase
MLKRTPIHDFHSSLGAKMVEFAGWEMPIMYRSIVDEHVHTRTSGSIFDVSHMGRFLISGPDALKFLDLVLTRNCSEMKVGQCRYSLVCNTAGGTLDDVIISRDQKNWILVCNASNREKLLRHFNEVRRTNNLDFDLADNTEATVMVAIQGPNVVDRMSELLNVDVKSMKKYSFMSGSYMMLLKYTLFRSGYTGEDGIELILPGKAASMALKMLGGKFDKPDATIKPAGLGARDTLRLEAGMPLYGHELGESIDPISAGLNWAVDLKKDFIGADALRVIAGTGPARKLVGLELSGRRIARQGAPVKNGETIVGEVTSGTFGPTVQKSIAMAFVDIHFAIEGTQLACDLRGAIEPCKVVKLPFYKRVTN